MIECSKGCGRRVQVRGMCNSHYQAACKYEINRQRWSRRPSIGTARRIRALIALGHSQSEIARALGMGPTYISKLAANNRGQVNPDTERRVTALYDKLSMTPGPSQAARELAKAKGWMPPLAWDDDAIDDPDAQPDPGHQERVSFTERFMELRDLGYSDIEILDRWGIQAESLMRQLIRHGIKAQPELATAASTAKWSRQTERVS